MSFKVAIIGRPNVGKSTIFNRLTGTREAIVHDRPGITRDRKEGFAEIGDLKFTVIDTAGLEKAETDSLEALMMEQTETAIDDADIILMTMDGRDGVTPIDEDFASMIRKKNKPTIMLVNKTESAKGTSGVAEAFKLGFGTPVAVSAEHGLGFGDLYDEIKEKSEMLGLEETIEEESDLQICILGRPNVGKSTLFNSIIGENRSIASDYAGTTRDSVYINIEYGGQTIKLVDTAGIRKRMKRNDYVEELSVSDSMKALQYANVAIMVLDASLGIDKMDLQLANKILEEGRGLVFAINKWDLLNDESRKMFKAVLDEKLNYSMSQAKNCAVVYCSALKGKNVTQIIDESQNTYETWNMRVSTGQLNKWLEKATEQNIPPLSRGKRIKFKYITQIKSRPPTFHIHSSSNLKDLPDSYIRYLKNSLDKTFGFTGIPVRIILKKSDNPYN